MKRSFVVFYKLLGLLAGVEHQILKSVMRVTEPFIYYNSIMLYCINVILQSGCKVFAENATRIKFSFELWYFLKNRTLRLLKPLDTQP